MEQRKENTPTATISKNKNVTMLIMAMIAVLASYAAYRAFSSGGDATAAATKVEKEKPATYLTLKNAAIGGVACGIIWALVRFKPWKNFTNQKPPQNNGGPNIWELNQKWQREGLGADKFKPSTNKNTYGATQQPAKNPTETTTNEGVVYGPKTKEQHYNDTQQPANKPTETTTDEGVVYGPKTKEQHYKDTQQPANKPTETTPTDTKK